MDLELDERTIAADERLLAEVWINLIDNAIKFSPDGGRVEIFALDKGERLSVRIINEGKEIPVEKRERLFTKFYQADEAHQSYGSGIGLAIVKRVVDLHMGEVVVDCEDGKVIFTVTLPKSHIAAPAQ